MRPQSPRGEAGTPDVFATNSETSGSRGRLRFLKPDARQAAAMLDGLDDAVAATFERALEALSRAGALIERIEVPEFHDVGVMNAKGGFAAPEGFEELERRRYVDTELIVLRHRA